MEQAFNMLPSSGTMPLVGLPPSQIAWRVFDTILKRLTAGNDEEHRADHEKALPSILK
jgi:propanol-preferring alcohol dehydrogenase